MLMIEAGVEYAIAFCEGQTTAALDEEVLFEKIKAIGGETVAISNFVDEAAGELDNFYMLLCPFYDF